MTFGKNRNILPLSTVLTAILESIFPKTDWEGKGVNIDGEYLNHLRFADDISYTTEALTGLQQMLDVLNKESKKVGLKLNKSKTMIMFNDKATPKPLKLTGR